MKFNLSKGELKANIDGQVILLGKKVDRTYNILNGILFTEGDDGTNLRNIMYFNGVELRQVNSCEGHSRFLSSTHDGKFVLFLDDQDENTFEKNNFKIFNLCNGKVTLISENTRFLLAVLYYQSEDNFRIIYNKPNNTSKNTLCEDVYCYCQNSDKSTLLVPNAREITFFMCDEITLRFIYVQNNSPQYQTEGIVGVFENDRTIIKYEGLFEEYAVLEQSSHDFALELHYRTKSESKAKKYANRTGFVKYENLSLHEVKIADSSGSSNLQFHFFNADSKAFYVLQELCKKLSEIKICVMNLQMIYHKIFVEPLMKTILM